MNVLGFVRRLPRIAAQHVVGSGPSRPPMPVKPSVPDTVPGVPSPVERDPTPRPVYRDPYAGVVSGPLLVERTRWIQAWHQRRYGDDHGFCDIEWGPFRAEDI